MLDQAFSIADDFPPVEYDQWRALVEKELRGAPFDKKLVTHTYEGIDVQPVYTQSDAPTHAELPGFFPFTRGANPLGAVLTGWDIRPEYSHPDLESTNQAILSDLAGGSGSLLIRLDLAARSGLDPGESGAEELVGDDGVMAYSASDLDWALRDVLLEGVSVQLHAGAAFFPAAAALSALWRQRAVSPEDARGAFSADPLAALANVGRLPMSVEAALERLASLAAWTAENYPRVTSIGVDTSVYHNAGATAAQDIAFALATAVEYLRATTSAGLSVNQSARQFLFSFSLGTHHFLAISKLRAARRLWARVVEASGGSAEAGAMRIHARTSNRVLTRRDPYVNLLRNTVAMFAAELGGAEALTSLPFDALSGLPDPSSRRVARNTVLIMQEEGRLNRVVDPAGGSWFLERMTDELAEKAWAFFQEIERQGGMCGALQSGWVMERIDSAFTPRAKDIARRKDGITGVSEFPNLSEDPVVREPPECGRLRQRAVDRIASGRNGAPRSIEISDFDDAVAAAAEGATIGQIAKACGFHASSAEMTPIEAHSFAEPFEELRDASDAWQQKHGIRPQVFLVPMGPVAHHTARVNYAKNLFEAGGFDAIVGDTYVDVAGATAGFSNSRAAIAVICSSDQLYTDLVPELAPRLKEAGARTVVLAGHPADHETAWRQAGVDRFIFIKCDALATLRQLLAEEGVLAE